MTLSERLAAIEARRKAAHEDPEADYVDYADFLDDSTGFLLAALQRATNGLRGLVSDNRYNEAGRFASDCLADLERLAGSEKEVPND